MQVLYAHFPNSKCSTVDDVIASGGGDFVDPLCHGRDPRMTLLQDAVGPRGDVGSFAMFRELDEILQPSQPPAIAHDRQTWVDCGNGVWAGWERQFPPQPELLRRLCQVEGFPMLLGGAPWLLARLDELPFKRTRDAYYVPPGEPSEADVDANRLCLEVRRQIREGGDAWVRGEFPPESRKLVELSLMRNYRGNAAMFDALGLFDDLDKTLGPAVMLVTGIAANLAAKAAQISKNRG